MEGANDDLHAALSVREVIDALIQASEGITGVAEEYTEGADNIEEGFGHSTSQADEMRDKAGELEETADSLERAASELESLADEYQELINELETLNTGDVPDGGVFDRIVEIEERHELLLEEAKSRAEDALNEASF